MLRLLRGLLIAAVTLAAVTGCSGDGSAALVAKDVLVTAPMPGTSMSAGYMVLGNAGRESIRITRITSPQFGRVEMHESVVENDIVRMRELDELLIGPGDELALEPGGRHLMLLESTGEPDAVRLDFYSGEELLLSVDTRVRER